MADSLRSFIEQARIKGVQLTGAPRQELTAKIQQSGKKNKGKTITVAEAKKAQEKIEKAGGTDYLSTLGRTYPAGSLAKKLRKKFESEGYGLEDGYYVKRGGITQDIIEKTKGAGYQEEDIRSALAKDFAKTELDEQVVKFLGAGDYLRDPGTGSWSKKTAITVTGDATTPPIKPVPAGTVSGIYAGINPDNLPGATPAEIQYSMSIDPYKIQAKSAERLGRLQQATDLLGKKMAYGTEYDISKLSRLSALQQAKINQANYLYNLIPSAF